LLILLCSDVEKLYATGEFTIIKIILSNKKIVFHHEVAHSIYFNNIIYTYVVGEMYDESYIRMAPSDSSIKRNWSFTRNRK